MKKETEGFRSALGSIGKAGAFAGLVGVGLVLREGADEWTENQTLARQTAAVYKSTGGVANVLARDVEKLSQSIHRKTGVDDAAVTRAQNLLLTFKDVRNEVGRGPKTFDRATRAAVDMSVALGTDAKDAALQLGKALNDPEKGVTRLTRVGVTFTKEQTKTIKQLDRTGQTAKAQALILRELESEFGGSAEAYGKTFPAQLARARESLAEVSGEILERLAPALEDALEQVEHGVDVFGEWAESDKGADQIDALASGAMQLASGLKTAGGVVLETTGYLIRHRDVVVPVAAAVGSMWAAYRGYQILQSVNAVVGTATRVFDLHTAAATRSAIVSGQQRTQLSGLSSVASASAGSMLLVGSANRTAASGLTAAASASTAASAATDLAGARAAVSAPKFAGLARGAGAAAGALVGISGPAGAVIAAVGLVGGAIALAIDDEKKHERALKEAAAAYDAKARASFTAYDAMKLTGDAALSVAEADAAVARATANLTRVRNDDTASALDVRDAELQLARARVVQRDSLDAQTKAQETARQKRKAEIEATTVAVVGMNRLLELKEKDRKLEADLFKFGLTRLKNGDKNPYYDAEKMREATAAKTKFNREERDELERLGKFEKAWTDELERSKTSSWGRLEQKNGKYVFTIGRQHAIAAAQEKKLREATTGYVERDLGKLARIAAGKRAEQATAEQRAAENQKRLRRMTNQWLVGEFGKLSGQVKPKIDSANREVAKLGNVNIDRAKLLAKLSAPFKGIGSLISKTIGTVKVSISSILDLAFGGEGGGMVGPVNDVDQFNSLAARSGLVISSGYRPGDDGYHGQNRARDYAGSPGNMLKFARLMDTVAGPKLTELIHTPLGHGRKNGQRVSTSGFFGAAVAADHYDHVHVAVQRGGIIDGRRGAGIVRGVGMGDSVPALLEPGEVVVNRRAVSRLGGAQAVHAATNLASPRFGMAADRLALFSAGGIVKGGNGKPGGGMFPKPGGSTTPAGSIETVAQRIATAIAGAVQRAKVDASPTLQLKAANAAMVSSQKREIEIEKALPGLKQGLADTIAARGENLRDLAAARERAKANQSAVDAINDKVAKLRTGGETAAEKRQIADLVKTRDVRLATLKTANTEIKNREEREENLAKAIDTRRDAIQKLIDEEKNLDASQSDLADTIVQLREQLEAEQQAAFRDAAESAQELSTAQLDLRRAFAERTATTDDDRAVAVDALELARQREQIIRQQLADPDANRDTRLALLGQLAETIRAQTTFANSIAELDGVVGGGGEPGTVSGELRALVDAIRSITAAERSNVLPPMTVNFTQPIVGATGFLDTLHTIAGGTPPG